MGRKKHNLPCIPISACKAVEVEAQKAEPEEKAGNPGTPVEADDDRGSPNEGNKPKKGGENLQVSSVPEAEKMPLPETRALDAFLVNRKNNKTFTDASKTSSNILYGGSEIKISIPLQDQLNELNKLEDKYNEQLKNVEINDSNL